MGTVCSADPCVADAKRPRGREQEGTKKLTHLRTQRNEIFNSRLNQAVINQAYVYNVRARAGSGDGASRASVCTSRLHGAPTNAGFRLGERIGAAERISRASSASC